MDENGNTDTQDFEKQIQEMRAAQRSRRENADPTASTSQPTALERLIFSPPGPSSSPPRRNCIDYIGPPTSTTQTSPRRTISSHHCCLSTLLRCLPPPPEIQMNRQEDKTLSEYVDTSLSDKTSKLSIESRQGDGRTTASSTEFSWFKPGPSCCQTSTSSLMQTQEYTRPYSSSSQNKRRESDSESSSLEDTPCGSSPQNKKRRSATPSASFSLQQNLPSTSTYTSWSPTFTRQSDTSTSSAPQYFVLSSSSQSSPSTSNAGRSPTSSPTQSTRQRNAPRSNNPPSSSKSCPPRDYYVAYSQCQFATPTPLNRITLKPLLDRPKNARKVMKAKTRARLAGNEPFNLQRALKQKRQQVEKERLDIWWKPRHCWFVDKGILMPAPRKKCGSYKCIFHDITVKKVRKIVFSDSNYRWLRKPLQKLENEYLEYLQKINPSPVYDLEKRLSMFSLDEPGKNARDRYSEIVEKMKEFNVKDDDDDDDDEEEE